VQETQQQDSSPTAAGGTADQNAASQSGQAPGDSGGAEGTDEGDEPPESNRGQDDSPGDAGGGRPAAAAAEDDGEDSGDDEDGPENQPAQPISSQLSELLMDHNIRLDARSFEVQAPFSFGVSEEDFNRASKVLKGAGEIIRDVKKDATDAVETLLQPLTHSLNGFCVCLKS
jgi:hypothetical protein